VAPEQQDVLWLDVAVDHPLRVRVGEGVGDLVQDPHGVRDRELALARQPVSERLARDKRHHIEEEVVLRAGGENREDVRVLQVGGDFDFLPEPRGADLAREFGREQLDHDLAVERRLSREEETTHPAAAELALDVVGVPEGGL